MIGPPSACWGVQFIYLSTIYYCQRKRCNLCWAGYSNPTTSCDAEAEASASPACDHARVHACDASLRLRPLGFSVKQVIMPVPVSLSDTRTRARNTYDNLSSLTSLCGFCFFLISKEFVNNLIYISLMSGIHRNNL